MKSIKDIVDVLEHRGTVSNQVIVETSINAAIDVLKRIQHLSQPRTDFQGWPIEDVTLGRLKEFLNSVCDIDDNSKVRILMDDGMGYGALNGICSEMNVSDSLLNDGTKEIQFWF